MTSEGDHAERRRYIVYDRDEDTGFEIGRFQIQDQKIRMFLADPFEDLVVGSRHFQSRSERPETCRERTNASLVFRGDQNHHVCLFRWQGLCVSQDINLLLSGKLGVDNRAWHCGARVTPANLVESLPGVVACNGPDILRLHVIAEVDGRTVCPMTQ